MSAVFFNVMPLSCGVEGATPHEPLLAPLLQASSPSARVNNVLVPGLLQVKGALRRFQECSRKEKLIEVERVEAHRAETERQQMSLFEKFIAAGNEKADEPAKERAMLHGGFVVQEREEVYAASFHCLVEEWKDCGELKPRPKEMWTFGGRKEASDGEVCDSKQVSVYEMRKEWQKHEYARKMCRTKVVGGRLKAQVEEWRL